jgi:hyperosmotically inducible protein
MKVILALIVGVVIGVGAVWFYNTGQGKSAVRSTGDQLDNARSALQEKIQVLDLRPEQIKDDLERTGRVVRRKAREAGQAIADATADGRITTAIKTKFLGSKELSSMGISVNTTEGVVTLSGSVNSAEEISKAMLIAMETEGVREVISTLQVKGKPAKTS